MGEQRRRSRGAGTLGGRMHGRAGEGGTGAGLGPSTRSVRAPRPGPGHRHAGSLDLVTVSTDEWVFTMMYWGNGLGGWGYVLMTVIMLAFWGLLIAGAVLLVRYVAGDRRQVPTAPPSAGPDPRAVLAERFARGEINEEDYRQRLKVLSSV